MAPTAAATRKAAAQTAVRDAAAALALHALDTGQPLPEGRCLCGTPQDAHRGRTRRGANPDAGCPRYAADPAVAMAVAAVAARERLLLADVREDERRTRAARPASQRTGWSLGPSDTDTCRRKVFYRNLPPEGLERDATDTRKATMGNAAHLLALSARARLYPWRMHEHVVTIPGLDPRGHRVDEYDPVTGDVVDVKSAGDWAWTRLGTEGVQEAVWGQVALYALGLADAGHPVRTLRVLYIHRESGKEEAFSRPYDADYALATLDRLLATATALDVVAEQGLADPGALLPRDRSGPSTDALCRMCDFRSHCWSIPAAEAAGRSPEAYVLTEDDADVEHALAVYDAARAAEKEAKEAKAAALALVTGVEERRYGRYTYGYGAPGRPVPDVDGFLANVEALWDAPTRPPFAEIPRPQKPGSRGSLAIRAVRAATLEKEARAAAAAVAAEPADATAVADEHAEGVA